MTSQTQVPGYSCAPASRCPGARGLSRLARRRTQRRSRHWLGLLALVTAVFFLGVSPGPDGGSLAASAVPDPAPAPVAPPPAPAPVAPPPAPAPVAPPPTGSGPWRPLAAAISEDMQSFPGRYGVVIVDLADGSRWEYQADAKFHPASLIKMPVSLYVQDQVMAGKARWSDSVTYLAQDFESPGGGALETSPFGGTYSLENLVGRALRYSNNIAVNMLGRHFGWEGVRAFTHHIRGELFPGPLVTPGSVAGWWLHLYQLGREHPQQAEALVQPLREVAYAERIAVGIPTGVPMLHKFGSYNGYFHDSALVQGQHPFVLVVLTDGATEEQADQAIARVARTVWSFMQGR